MYINLSTLRNIGEKIGVQGKCKYELLSAILNKLEIQMTPLPPQPTRKVEMVKK